MTWSINSSCYISIKNGLSWHGNRLTSSVIHLVLRFSTHHPQYPSASRPATLTRSVTQSRLIMTIVNFSSGPAKQHLVLRNSCRHIGNFVLITIIATIPLLISGWPRSTYRVIASLWIREQVLSFTENPRGVELKLLRRPFHLYPASAAITWILHCISYFLVATSKFHDCWSSLGHS